jgi:phosphoadenosine phosphosulfate reductase
MSAIERNAHPSNKFADKLTATLTLLQLAEHDHAGHVSLACSLGAEDMVLAHLINQHRLDIGIFVLDTGLLHPETLSLLARLRAGSRAPVTVYGPVNLSVEQFVTRHGPEAMRESIPLRKACCHLRKTEPLGHALAGKTAWVTGLRREQSDARAEVPHIDISNAALVKINPLADWTWGDVWHFIEQNKVDYNPLHDQFYPSIGCAPCTRAISLGEDFRAGRWWWEDESSKECGLHVKIST